ncbi:MAG: FtsX-like permease family protein, partial [Acidobacteriota bacterium]
RGATGAGGSGGGRLRAALVVAEVSLALVLLVGAGLLTKSFLGLAATDPGFEPEGMVAVSMNLPQERYGEEERQRTFLRELRAALEANGLEDASLASTPPTMASIYFARNLAVEGRGGLPEGLVEMVSMVSADPGYFRTMVMRFAAGGPFSDRALEAGEGEERPIVINRSLARALWPEGPALGGRLKLGTAPDEPWSRVVGVIEDTAQLGLASTQDTFQMYFPLRRAARVSVLVRAPGVEPALVGERVAGLVRTVDPWLPVAQAVAVADLLGSSVAEERFEMALMLVFAAIALVLTVLGVYAVLAYAVRLRTFEIGVRSALGATPDRVLALVARQGALLVGLGLALGLAASLALGRVVESHLHGVPVRDPAVLGAAVVLLALTTALATLLPARRAARLDPAEVLRTE